MAEQHHHVQKQHHHQEQQGGRIVVCNPHSSSCLSSSPSSDVGGLSYDKGNIKPSSMNKLEQRYSFEYNGRKIYDFEQTLDEMKIFVRPPPVISSGKQVKCVIEATHLKLGLVSSSDGSNSSSTPQSWYLDEDTYDLVDVDESTWTLEDDDYYSDDSKVIAIYLIKARRGTLWESALKGNPNAVKAAGAPTMPMAKMDPIQKEQMKQSLLLQRFQEENPGFDFSTAEFNGAAPDAREFMGGVQYR